MSVKLNDTVKVHYTGTTISGEIFDSSVDREPLQFTVGEGNLLKDFEDAVLGMQLNESKKINIESVNAYGVVREDLIVRIDKANLGPGIEPELGMELYSQYPDGSEVVVRIVEIDNESILVDANHPLAGQDLSFDITLVEIQ